MILIVSSPTRLSLNSKLHNPYDFSVDHFSLYRERDYVATIKQMVINKTVVLQTFVFVLVPLVFIHYHMIDGRTVIVLEINPRHVTVKSQIPYFEEIISNRIIL